MGSYSADPEPPKLYIETPCIPSPALSRAAGCNIFLKLENLQPSGSFKSRGISTMMYRAMLAQQQKQQQSGNTQTQQTPPATRFYCSSGGNAGMACATAAATLGQKCTIVLPMTASELMMAKIRLLGAETVQVGANWAAADAHLRLELLANDPAGVYVPPFDHPDVWDGASTMVHELVDQLRGPIDAIVCNCGGGGLLNGIMQGIAKRYPAESPVAPPRVLAIETAGADSLDASVRAGELVTLPAITSIATSLGATRVSERTFRWTQEAEHLTNAVVSDAEAVMGCVRLADDACLLVEASCGATVCTVYNGELRRSLGAGLSDDQWRSKNVVLIVCGGVNISLDMLNAYREKYGIK